MPEIGPLPLIIGVTGHRQLPSDTDTLRQRVEGILDEIQREHAHTPLVVMSPLAEGADRLVARIASEKGLDLIVPLPWPQGACDQRLHRSGDRSEFDELLRHAQTIELPLVEGTTPRDLDSSPDHREKQYDQVGAYIARHSQILIALWDGDTSLEGGTAKVVSWQRMGKPAPYAPPVGILDRIENGPVYHVVTPRPGHPAPDPSLKVKLLFPQGEQGQASLEDLQEFFKRRRRHIDQFNLDAARLLSRSDDELRVSEGYLMTEEELTAIDQQDDLRCLRRRYAIADLASLRYQKATLRTLWGLFALAFGAVGLLEMYAHILMDRPLLLASYLVVVFLGAGWYLLSHRRDFQRKYLDYRALAEALRVQFFWRLACLDESVADHYLRTYRSELDWIRQAARTWNLVCGTHRCDPRSAGHPTLPGRLRSVLENWFENQKDFFKRKAPLNNRLAKTCHRMAATVFAIAIGLVAIQLTMHHNHYLLVAIFMAFITAAMIHNYADQRAFEVHARKYEWMESLYETATSKLRLLLEPGESAADSPQLEDAQALILEVGDEALTENADWVIQHRHRPITMPEPG